MKRRSQSDWQAVILEQSESSLSVAEFCKRHNIGQSYFYKIKNDLKAGNIVKESADFIKVNPSISAPPQQRESINLHHEQTQLSLPSSISAIWIADLIKALS